MTQKCAENSITSALFAAPNLRLPLQQRAVMI